MDLYAESKVLYAVTDRSVVATKREWKCRAEMPNLRLYR